MARLTRVEAEWLCCVLETFTNTQDIPAEEAIRQSAWAKLRAMRRALSPKPRAKGAREGQ
jgi:hypothetical protein